MFDTNPSTLYTLHPSHHNNEMKKGSWGGTPIRIQHQQFTVAYIQLKIQSKTKRYALEWGWEMLGWGGKCRKILFIMFSLLQQY